MITARPAGAAALLAAALLAGGCGEDRGASTSTGTTAAPAAPPTQVPPPPAGPPPATVKVREAEYRLDPAQIRVDRPATLEIDLRNAGDERHALEVEDGGSGVRSRTLAPGESQRLRVELSKPGRYRWSCPLDGHARRGMRGSIAVAHGGG